MTARLFFPAAAVFILLQLACGDGGASGRFVNSTVSSRRQAAGLTAFKAPPPGVFLRRASGIRPLSGTVSHHLLCGPVINEWFVNLKKLRGVSTFVIISPNHGRLGRYAVSLTERGWDTAGKITRTNRRLAGGILRCLGIGTDDGAFVNEHGVEALLPFINAHFPDADVVPVLLDEKQRHVPLLMGLSGVLAKITADDPGVFLLVSADFSHRRGRRETDINDGKSFEALRAMGKRGRAVSDNSGGLSVMFDVCGKNGASSTHFFCRTDSEKFAPVADGDITSYFFTFQY